ncbi:hypothetical protein AMECASPLE_009534 [Ameca splendens]|uniref:Uncharacterized protein n=1 Tax=Ameca splendens TaxID=208324 RepID=A0ABV0ZW72_9TELE
MALLSKCDADHARCNICDVNCKASSRNTSNLRSTWLSTRFFLLASDLQLQLNGLGADYHKMGVCITRLRSLLAVYVLLLSNVIYTNHAEDTTNVEECALVR